MTLFNHRPVDPYEPTRSILRMLQTERALPGTTKTWRNGVPLFSRYMPHIGEDEPPRLIGKQVSTWNTFNVITKITVVSSLVLSSLILFELGLRGLSYTVKKYNLAEKNSRLRNGLKFLSSYSPLGRLNTSDVYRLPRGLDSDQHKMGERNINQWIKSANYKRPFTTKQLFYSLFGIAALNVLYFRSR